MKIGFRIPIVVGAPIDIPRLAKFGEDLGFESIWASEHPMIPVVTTTPHPGRANGTYDPSLAHMTDPFVTLAMAAAATTKLKMGTAICLVTVRNPIVTAKEVATLDFLSGGRFIFGIGAGIFEEELTIMGGDFPHRWSQAREATEAMKELWAEDEAEYHGKYYDFPPVRSFPKPVQKPHPPIFHGGGADPLGTDPEKTLRRVARWGDGWMPNWIGPERVRECRDRLDELAAKAGRDPRSIEISLTSRPADRKLIERFQEAGATRVEITLRGSRSTDEALFKLEAAAKEVIYQPSSGTSLALTPDRKVFPEPGG